MAGGCPCGRRFSDQVITPSTDGLPADVPRSVDVLLPTCDRPAALAVVLTALLGQTSDPGLPSLRVIVADQSVQPVADDPVVAGVLRVLRYTGVDVLVLRRPRRLGIAENRQALLDAAAAEVLVCLDDDVVLAPGALCRGLGALVRHDAGLVGLAAAGLSHLHDVRPQEWASFERVTGRPGSERVRKDTPGWARWRLHNAANSAHLAERHPPGAGEEVTAYRIAWSAGCWLARRADVLAVGGWAFWTDLPREHRAEDLVVQLRLQDRRGAVGVLPSGAFHLELPTTLARRDADAYALVLEAADRAGPASSADRQPAPSPPTAPRG